MNITTPASAAAEQAVLASILMDPNYGMRCCIEAGVQSSTFYFPGHAIVWETMLEFWKDNEPIELIALTMDMGKRDVLKRAGGSIDGGAITGAAFLTKLQTLLPSGGNIGTYIAEIREMAIRRVIDLECQTIRAKALNTAEDYDEMFATVQSGMLKIMKLHEGQRIHQRDMKEIMRMVTDSIEGALNGTGEIELPYGIAELDYLTQGMRAPEMTVIAGRSSEGKTALALCVARHLAMERGKRVGIISLEMADVAMGKRLLANEAEVDIGAVMRDRRISGSEQQRIIDAAVRLSSANIYIRDDAPLSIAEISATFAAWKSKHGLDIGIIDHAQLAKGDGKTNGRTEEVESVSRAIKPMAKRLGIPLIVLSQVTDDGKGSVSMKNSKALSEDADTLLQIVRRDDKVFVHIGKQREGPRYKDVEVIFDETTGRFSGIPKEEHAEQVPLLPNGKKSTAKNFATFRK